MLQARAPILFGRPQEERSKFYAVWGEGFDWLPAMQQDTVNLNALGEDHSDHE
jgi:hypothetical protein